MTRRASLPHAFRERTNSNPVAAAVAAALGLAMLAPRAQAQSVPPLLNPSLVAKYTPVELGFATAVSSLNQYVNTNSGSLCQQQCPTEFATLRRDLNRFADGGENGFGYNLTTPEQLNNVLRWLAPEELFAITPITTGFVNGQLGMLNNRISALRSVSRAQLFAHNVVSPTLKNGYASAAGAQGGAGAGFSRINLFFDGSMGFGKRADTTEAGSEDAFDFDSAEFTMGLDSRYSDNLVAGAMLGYTSRKVDFNPGASAADGSIDAAGWSLLAFAQWDERRWYGSFALGYQMLGYDTYRRIDVLSEAPMGTTIAPDDAAKGSPDGTGLLASLNLGLPFEFGAWGTDLYFNTAWQRLTVDRFSERLVDINPDEDYAGYTYNVGKQNINSLDTSLGLKVQYVMTPSYGVVVPFVRAELHREWEDSPHRIDLEFQGLDAVEEFAPDPEAFENATSFNLHSDRPDKSWVSASLGVSAVIRGSTRVSSAGRGGGGLQCYLVYSTAFGLAHYDNSAIMAGLRYEF